MHRRSWVVGLVVSLVFVSGIALASDSGEVINACIGPNGLTFIVDDVSECGQNDMVLTWNTQGLQGEKGDPGEPGLPGPPGDLTMEGWDAALYRTGGNYVVTPGAGQQSFSLSCDRWPDRAISGSWTNLYPEIRVVTSAPNGRGWLFVLVNNDMTTPTGSDRYAGLQIECLDMSPDA